MDKLTDTEKQVKKYYELIWSEFNPWLSTKGKFGYHFGFFEKNIKTLDEAYANTNDFVGRLIELDKAKTLKILDTGCGVGGTLLYLAEKYPNVRFIGITLTTLEIILAKNYAKEKNIKNVDFFVGNFIQTPFLDNYFDSIFALESLNYARDKKKFIHEMYRILKPNGKLVIIDGFRTDITMGSFMRQIYRIFLNDRKLPNIVNLNIFEKYLISEGFKDIDIINLKKYIRRYIIMVFLIEFPFIVYSLVKNIKLSRGNKMMAQKQSRQGKYILDVIIGVSKIVEYNVITAIKMEK